EVDALTTHLPHAPRNQPDRAQCAPSVDGRVLVVTAEGAEHEHPGNGNGVHPRRCAAEPERDAERKPDGDQPPHRPQARRCATAPSVQSMSPLGQCSARLKICATSAMPAPRATVPTACNATASP